MRTHGDMRVDAVVVVSTTASVQTRACWQRAGMTMEKLEAILAKPMPDAEKRRRVHFVMDTPRQRARVRAQVLAIRG